MCHKGRRVRNVPKGVHYVPISWVLARRGVCLRRWRNGCRQGRQHACQERALLMRPSEPLPIAANGVRVTKPLTKSEREESVKAAMCPGSGTPVTWTTFKWGRGGVKAEGGSAGEPKPCVPMTPQAVRGGRGEGVKGGG